MYIIDLFCLFVFFSSRLISANGRDVTKRAIIEGNSIVSGRNYDMLTLVIALKNVTAIASLVRPRAPKWGGGAQK